jgi:hypothetical protein
MTKYELGHIYLIFIMNLDRDAFAIVPDGNEVFLLIDLHLDSVHGIVPLVVISCVHNDLIKDLIKTRHEFYLSRFEMFLIF